MAEQKWKMRRSRNVPPTIVKIEKKKLRFYHRENGRGGHATRLGEWNLFSCGEGMAKIDQKGEKGAWSSDGGGGRGYYKTTGGEGRFLGFEKNTRDEGGAAREGSVNLLS